MLSRHELTNEGEGVVDWKWDLILSSQNKLSGINSCNLFFKISSLTLVILLTSQDHVAMTRLDFELVNGSPAVAIMKGALQLGREGIGIDEGCHEGNYDCRNSTSPPCWGEGHRGGKTRRVRSGCIQVCRWTTVMTLASWWPAPRYFILFWRGMAFSIEISSQSFMLDKLQHLARPSFLSSLHMRQSLSHDVTPTGQLPLPCAPWVRRLPMQQVEHKLTVVTNFTMQGIATY